MNENQHWFSQLYHDNLILIGIIYFGTFFSRFFINVKIANIENNTNKGAFDYSRFEHLILMVMWWGKVKKEGRKLATLSNILGIIWVMVFVGILIGLTISGDIY